MVRLGYAGCRACHLAPQGAGLLTDYGKGVDQAQSLLGDEYPSDRVLTERLLRYDVRLLTSGWWTTAAPPAVGMTPPPLLRLFLRSSARLGSRNRVASTLLIETPRGEGGQIWTTSPVVDATAAWEFRASDVLTVSVNRDRLPRGVELGEVRTILDEMNRDRFPTQVRAFIDSNRAHLTLYAFGPGSTRTWNDRIRGAGALGDVQFFRHHVVLGVSGRARFSAQAHERTIGSHARIGFGTWGVLTEHEFTRRTEETGRESLSQRHGGYTQVFFAPWEWLVASITGEYSLEPGVDRGWAVRWYPGVQARLSSNVTVTAGTRSEVGPWVDVPLRMFLVEIALKTVQ